MYHAEGWAVISLTNIFLEPQPLLYKKQLTSVTYVAVFIIVFAYCLFGMWNISFLSYQNNDVTYEHESFQCLGFLYLCFGI